MPIRRNGYYNDPKIAKAAESLASMFAPPSAADQFAIAKARGQNDENARLSDLYALSQQQNFDQTGFDRRAIAAGRYSPNASFYAVDANNRTSVANNASDNLRALQQTRLTQAGETDRAFLTPVANGATRFVPPRLADLYGVDPTQVGVLEAKPGERIITPDGRELQGNDKPMSDAEMKGKILGTLPEADQRSVVMQGVPTENIVTPEGTRIVPRDQAYGQTAAVDATKDQRPSQAHQMRQELVQHPAAKNYSQAAPIFNAMVSTEGTNSKASDLNLVYGLGKIFDPTSVVREGEIEMAKNTAGWGEKLKGAFEALKGGAALTPETRASLLQEAYGRMKGYEDAYEPELNRYGGIADRLGINRADVLPEFKRASPYENKFKTVMEDAPAAAPVPVAPVPQASSAPASAATPGAVPGASQATPGFKILKVR